MSSSFTSLGSSASAHSMLPSVAPSSSNFTITAVSTTTASGGAGSYLGGSFAATATGGAGAADSAGVVSPTASPAVTSYPIVGYTGANRVCYLRTAVIDVSDNKTMTVW